jgi:predicted dehydrogenase
MSEGRRAILWLSPAQVPLARAAAQSAELEIVGAGSPERGQAGRVAAELAVGPPPPRALDDLRAALAGADADLFLIADPGTLGASGADEDAAAILAAHARGVRVATLEPIPANTTDLAAPAWTDGAPRAIDVPVFAPLWPPSLPPAEVLGHAGPVRTLALEWWGRPGEGSLAARLFGAMELILRLLGEPESIDAAYVAPGPARGVHALPGESLRGLTGDLTGNLRFSDGRCATIAISDHASRWGRALSLLGPGGRVRVEDHAWAWFDREGRRIDELKHRSSPRQPAEDQPPIAAGALAASLNQLLGPVPQAPRSDPVVVLALCHAALLSARTGQCESPETIKRIAGVA